VETISKINYSERAPEQKQYEGVEFAACNFSNANLSSCKFIDCVFTDCDLSMAQLRQSSFQDVVFRSSKLLGLQFDKCSAFALSFRFEKCAMDHVVFYKVKMPGTHFQNCKIREADFTEALADKVCFDHCDLQSTVFERSSLINADFRTAYNFGLDPELNKVKGARFSTDGLVGLLGKYALRID
jgi:fluoroquinolone resistance protein